MLGGQEGANQISETLTSESTKQIKVGIPAEVADNTKKETKLATINEDGEQILDNVSGGMMINEGDKQDQTFGDYMNKKDADKKGADN
jgi:plastocyanin domain-containing protein